MINVQVIGVTAQLKQALERDNIQVSFLEDEVQALNTVEETQPAVILLNYNVRKVETESYIKLLLKMSCASKIVIVADDELNDTEILACLMAGAKGYQNTSQLNDYVVKMVKVIEAGEAWITRRLVAKLLNILIDKQSLHIEG